MSPAPSPTRRAKAVSLAQFGAQRDGVLTLDADTYHDLRERGLDRADVRQATDDLVAEGAVTVTARLGRVRIFMNEISP